MAVSTPETTIVTSTTTSTTLSEIFNVDPVLMQRKFNLEPLHRYDPQEKDNLVFLSPTVLLEDLELRQGGWKDWGAKKVLGVLAKDILKSKDHSLFQVPEITHFHMGYAKRSVNKHNMAITEEEAKKWMKYFDLAEWKARMSSAGDEDEAQREGETPSPMDIEVDVDEEDFTFPTQEDTQALEYENEDGEDVIDPNDSGLQIRGVKSGYLLFFSILLIFYKKKKEPSLSKANIAENKMSDFLLFWILPYLLFFTEQQLRIVNKHHEVEAKRNGTPQFSVPSVKKSAMDIFRDAFEACRVPTWLRETLRKKLVEYYHEDLLEHKYELPAVTAAVTEPIILVPLRYQLTKMPVEIEEIGRRWREIGNIQLVDQFVDEFVTNPRIQEDFLHDAIRELEEKEKFAVNYGILLPDEDTFSDLIEEIQKKEHGIFRRLKCMKSQGRNHATPRLGLVKTAEGNLSVCFSYFQGNDSKNVATLFRITGAHRLSHFTLAVLHGACINPDDPRCKLLSLYPVKSATKFEIKDGKLKKCKVGENNEGFESGEEFLKGEFCRLEFPETFNSFKQAVCSEGVVKNLVTNSNGRIDYPVFEHRYPLTVAYTKASQVSKLKKSVLGAAVAPTSRKHGRKHQIKALEKYQVRAANLEGCLLYFIKRSGCKGNVGVVLAINDTLEPYGALLPGLEKATMRTITNFVEAVVVADLPAVYPPDGPDTEREVESGTEDDDEDDSDSDDDSNDENEAGAMIAPPASATPQIKTGVPSDDELQRLALDLESWRPLGRVLGFSEAQLTGFDEDNNKFSEKAYKMLLRWTSRDGSGATYEVLYRALCQDTVQQTRLAEKYCCRD